MSTKSLHVRSYTRRSPADPHAEKRAETTQLLREFVIFRDLEREIDRIVDEAARREREFWLTGGLAL